MSNHSDGAVLWSRSTTDSEIFKNKPDKWFKIWFYFVEKARFADSDFPRGSNYTRYEWIMEKTKASKDQCAKFIAWAKDKQMLATTKATHGFIFSVLKYEDYQNFDNYKSNSKSKMKATQKQHESSNIKKNDNKDNNIISKDIITSPKFSEDSVELKLANLLLEKILHRNPFYKKPDLQKWAAEIDKMIRLDSRTEIQIQTVIEWCQQDIFWKYNILSTLKLREHFDKLVAKAMSNYEQQSSNVAFISN